MELKMKEPN